MTGRGSGASAAPEPRHTACPSAPAAPGALLLGVLGGDGRIHNLRTPVAVDAGFLERAARAGPVEARMRFAGRCEASGCTQWTGTRCGVIDRAMALLDRDTPPPSSQPLPPCTIRADCRWFAQRGAGACGTCSLIVTDTRGRDSGDRDGAAGSYLNRSSADMPSQ
jgi:hypothetical protein